MPLIEVRMAEEEKEGTEASLRAWFKAPGDLISQHEPLAEINTDKVTLEIAAAATGRIHELLKQPGDIVLPGDLLATIETDASDANSIAVTEPALPAAPKRVTSITMPASAQATYSPAVRKLLSELDLDPTTIPKVTRGSRITPDDIAAHLKAQTHPTVSAQTSNPEAPITGRKIPHTPMRKSIAKHMLHSMQTAPHVTSVFEADLFNVLAAREARKQAASGDAPSITAYILRAAVQAILLVPQVNSKWHDAFLEQFDHIHFGVGTALSDGGLVVPVIRDAQDMDLPTLSQALRDITTKAREGRLAQSDMEGGTFTLSNHGIGGSLLAAPIILPHGQAAILGTGKIQKRVIVCETSGRELFRVRPMMYVTLTVDHRALDGQQTNRFLTEFVKALENPA